MNTRPSPYLREVNSMVDGRYTIVRILANKGMSYVYVCMDNNLNKLVVLKEIIKKDAGRDGVNYHALVNESKLMSSLNHAGIPRILSMEEDDDRAIIFMDLVSGEDMETLVKREGQLPEDFVVSKMTQLAIILGYLHNLKYPVFYRDLKPSNVMLQEGSVKLLDFGISTQINPENHTILQPLGSKGFAAPEQAKVGNPYDLRSDIYSFGATMFSLLTGKNPAQTNYDFDVSKYNPKVSIGLNQIIGKCTQKDPDDRYDSIEEVLASLKIYRNVDDEAKSRFRKRFIAANTLLAVGLICGAGSAAAVAAQFNQDANQYSALLAKAQTSQDIKDYVPAIDANPKNIDPYFDLITEIKSGDGVFDDADEAVLLNVMNNHSEEIISNSRYPELAYNIGALYWFFYNSDSGAQGQVISTKWFKQSLDADYNTEQSRAFYNMGSFNRDIASNIQTATDSGMYVAYWNMLREVDTNNLSEVMSLQLNNYLVDTIQTYGPRLRSDGVERKEMQEVVQQIQAYIAANPNPTEGRPQELMNTLKGKMGNIPRIVDTIYGRG